MPHVYNVIRLLRSPNYVGEKRNQRQFNHKNAWKSKNFGVLNAKKLENQIRKTISLFYHWMNRWRKKMVISTGCWKFLYVKYERCNMGTSVEWASRKSVRNDENVPLSDAITITIHSGRVVRVFTRVFKQSRGNK